MLAPSGCLQRAPLSSIEPVPREQREQFGAAAQFEPLVHAADVGVESWRRELEFLRRRFRPAEFSSAET
jgi:hypothetical protein